jgi:hypothetical protein
MSAYYVQAKSALEWARLGCSVPGRLGATVAGANRIVRRLRALGILGEMTGQARHRRFRYDACVRLFEEEAAT